MVVAMVFGNSQMMKKHNYMVSEINKKTIQSSFMKLGM